MESVFVKNMPEATVNRTNQKKTKNKKKQKKKKQNPEGNVPARVYSEFPQVFFFVVFLFFLFFFYIVQKAFW